MRLEYAEILRDIRIKIKEARDEKMIVPTVIDEILDEVEKEYESI